MEAFYYIFTATAANDYCSLVCPDISFFNKEVKEHFIKRVRNLINIDAYGVGILNAPIWLLIKEGDLILWGIGCKTSELSELTDEFGRTLRTFVGIFIRTGNTNNIKLPYEIEFFKRAFEEIVLPQWNVYTTGIYNKECTRLEARECIKPNFSTSQLNIDYHYCRAFNCKCTDAKLLFEQALGMNYDISIASNVVDLNQVINSNNGAIPLMNAVCQIHGEQYRDIQVKHECRKCGNKVFDLKDGMCLPCWDEEHRTFYIPDETSQKSQCRKCFREYVFVLSDGLCEICHDNERDKKWMFRLGIAIVVAFVIGIVFSLVFLIHCNTEENVGKERVDNTSQSYSGFDSSILQNANIEGVNRVNDSESEHISTGVIDDPSFTDEVRVNQ